MIGEKTNIVLAETTVTTFSDDKTTKILKPFYRWIGGTEGIDGDTLTIEASLVDDSSIQRYVRKFDFVGEDMGEVSVGFRHKIRIKLPAVKNSDYRDWLLDFCLRQNKQIDTTGVLKYQGKVYNVVNAGAGLSWTFERGLSEAPAIELSFLEKTLRTGTESVVPFGGMIWDVDQWDVGEWR